MASTLAEMSRMALAHDFRHIDPASARICLYEAEPRILPTFPEHLSMKALRHLESLGVRVYTNARVTSVDSAGIVVGGQRVLAATVLWGISRNRVLLAFASLFADISSEMLYPILPIFLTQVLHAGGSVVGVVEGIAEATQNLVQGFSGLVVGLGRRLVSGGGRQRGCEIPMIGRLSHLLSRTRGACA